MTAYPRRTGRALPCINSNDTDYKHHKMRTIYMRQSMDSRGRNHRTMTAIGYYCSKCEKFWTDDDRMDWIVGRVSREGYTTTATVSL